MRYPEIENTYRKKLLDEIRQRQISTEWVVEEKIHGANFSFWITTSEIKVAKRTAFLTESELDKFYHSKKVVERHRETCTKFFSTIRKWASEKEYGDIILAIVYGELFGGWYPHPDVPKVPDVAPIQKEIYYHPDLKFCAFDVYLQTETGKSFFLDVSTRTSLLEHAGFMVSQPLMTGTLDECLQYPNKFQTTIPRRFNLPEIENNICEGVVIRPVIDFNLQTYRRAIFKNKNELYSEVRPRKTKKDDPYQKMQKNPKMQALIATLLKYHTKARFQSVQTKIGPINSQELPKIVGLYVKDLLKDFSKDHPAILEQLNKKDRKVLSKLVFEKVKPDLIEWLKKA